MNKWFMSQAIEHQWKSGEFRGRKCKAGCEGCIERCEISGWQRVNMAFNWAFRAQVTQGSPNTWILIKRDVQVGVHVTDRRRLGVLLPDTGLSEPDVSSSSADDQDDKSWPSQLKRDTVMSKQTYFTPLGKLLFYYQHNSFYFRKAKAKTNCWMLHQSKNTKHYSVTD